MKPTNVTPPPHTSDNPSRDVQKPGEAYTPAQFFYEVGITIAACLALGVLAQLLVAIVGAH